MTEPISSPDPSQTMACPSKVCGISLWSARIIAAGILIMAAPSKIMGAEEALKYLAQAGIGHGATLAIGLAELVVAVLLLIPRTSGPAALAAIGIMIGALVAHVLFLGMDGKVVMALLVLAASAYIAWAWFTSLRLRQSDTDN